MEGQRSGTGAGGRRGTARPAGRRPRVLLADDHTRLREALRDLLEETGFEIVGESGDGPDAVAMASQLEPDIVVVDLPMPVLNGLDPTRLIRDAVLAARAG
jgi:response regulator NasT